MTPFTYLEPVDLQAAVSLLAQYGSRAKVMAGGQSLLLELKERSIRPDFVMSLARLPELRGIQYTSTGELEIGATTTYAEVGAAGLRGWHAQISGVCLDLADRSVRNMGTLGGSACQADPRFDIPTLLVGLNALISTMGPLGEKKISSSDFFLPEGGTSLQPCEVLTKLTVPALPVYSVIAFEKFRYRAFDAALVIACCAVRLGPGNVVDSARIAVGAVNRGVRLACKSAERLLGSPMTKRAIALVADETVDEVFSTESVGARLRSYQFELTKTLVRRIFTRMTAT